MTKSQGRSRRGSEILRDTDCERQIRDHNAKIIKDAQTVRDGETETTVFRDTQRHIDCERQRDRDHNTQRYSEIHNL